MSRKHSRVRKFFSYYRPYLGLFSADMACAVIASAAMLAISEKAVQNTIERLMKNRTTLVIAHRLSTIRNAHRILVLTDKGIEEQGTHQELIALDKTYASLYNMQLRIEDTGEKT